MAGPEHAPITPISEERTRQIIREELCIMFGLPVEALNAVDWPAGFRRALKAKASGELFESLSQVTDLMMQRLLERRKNAQGS